MEEYTNQPYIRFNDIPFTDIEDRNFCERIYKEIVRLDSAVSYDEEFIDHLRRTVGPEVVKMIPQNVITLSKKISIALKMIFWYYTGIDHHKVLYDLDEDEIDIFNL